MSPRSILIVDDDRLVGESLCDILSDLGYVVRATWDGLRAMQILLEEPAGLLFSDVDMPDISGFELLARVHRLPQPPAVILMSARADARLDEAAHAAGAISLLAKPVSIAPVRQIVQRLLP